MGRLVHFMQSAVGRLARIVAGLALIGVGFLVMHGVGGVIVAIVGLVPLFAGLAGICLFAPLVGYTLQGKPRTGHAHP
jgi:hypothetical protein